MATYKIEFADVIDSVDVSIDQQKNYLDKYLDGHIVSLKNITTLIQNLEELEAVYFTRSTFYGVPNIHSAVMGISNLCDQHHIRFATLKTPARFANAAKQAQWLETIVR